MSRTFDNLEMGVSDDILSKVKAIKISFHGLGKTRLEENVIKHYEFGLLRKKLNLCLIACSLCIQIIHARARIARCFRLKIGWNYLQFANAYICDLVFLSSIMISLIRNTDEDYCF